MTGPTPEQRALLAPDPSDRRTVRLGKLAILSLLERGAEVTRTTLPAEARLLDTGHKGKKRGLSEASLDHNGRLRALYEATRANEPPVTPRRTGRVSAQVHRMTSWSLARALVVARGATAEKEDEHRRALARYGKPFETTEVDALAAERRGLRANLVPADPPAAGAARCVAGEASVRAVKAALGKRSSNGSGLGLERLAQTAKVHVSTVRRVLARLREEERALRECREPVLPPSRLVRLPRRLLAHALQVERDYIQALARAADLMAPLIRERDLNEWRLRLRKP